MSGPWADREEGAHDNACSECEIWILIRIVVQGGFHYDRRNTGSGAWGRTARVQNHMSAGKACARAFRKSLRACVCAAPPAPSSSSSSSSSSSRLFCLPPGGKVFASSAVLLCLLPRARAAGASAQGAQGARRPAEASGGSPWAEAGGWALMPSRSRSRSSGDATAALVSPKGHGKAAITYSTALPLRVRCCSGFHTAAAELQGHWAVHLRLPCYTGDHIPLDVGSPGSFLRSLGVSFWSVWKLFGLPLDPFGAHFGPARPSS